MLKFNVTPAKEKQLALRMEQLKIFEKDLEETFVKAPGRGGQKVNKSSTCVNLKHIPTGIVVKCSSERSQSLNRFFARRLLVSKIEKIRLGKKSNKEIEAEKLRKQKLKRKKKSSIKYSKDSLK